MADMAYDTTMLVEAASQLQLEDPDLWSWESFLDVAPLNVRVHLQPLTRNIDVKNEYFSSDGKSLVERFREGLDSQHSKTADDKKSKVNCAKAALQSFVLPASPVTVGGTIIKFPFEDLEEKWKHYKSALEIKSDRESSGTTWTINMIKRYIRRQDIVFIQPEIRLDLTGEVLQKIRERVDMSVKAICGSRSPPTESLLATVATDTTEADIKTILDAILQPLCVYKGLLLRSEQNRRCNKLPNNRYDFIMYFDNMPVGVVEAKRQGCLKDNSVAQLLVQLLLLSAEEPNRFYFGVLSDACHLIFAGVTRKCVVFFQTNDTALEIATVKSDHDLASIACKISWLADLAIQSREKSIEDFLVPVMCLKVRDNFFKVEQPLYLS